MIKTLNFNNEKFQAEKIIKTETDIIGQDINGNEVFAFRGISDFTGFSLEEGQEFDKSQEQINQEKLDLMQKAIDDLIFGGAL
jgi:hypothetical protein